MLITIKLSFFKIWCYAECLYAEYRVWFNITTLSITTHFHYAWFDYAKCHVLFGVMLSVMMLSVMMLSVIMLIVIMLSVVTGSE